jgi:hypothetical protein
MSKKMKNEKNEKLTRRNWNMARNAEKPAK